jgi:hypothetical protein
MSEHHASLDVTWRRATGTAGVVSALALVMGDVLFTSDASAEDLVVARSQVPTAQLYVSGVLGLTASWLYAAAAWQVYFALRPAGKTLASATFVAFTTMLIGAAVYHAVFPALMFGARVAVLAGRESNVGELALALPEGYNAILLAVAVILPSTVFTVLFTYTLLWRPTDLPRWTILLTPLVLIVIYMVAGQFLASTLPSLFSARLYGSIYNIATLLFFVASTFSLWNGGHHQRHAIGQGSQAIIQNTPR